VIGCVPDDGEINRQNQNCRSGLCGKWDEQASVPWVEIISLGDSRNYLR
jgi:hypothetical protein